MLKQLRSYVLYAAVFAIPWFFLPITQEFFLIQKLYLVLITLLLSFVLLGASVIINKKIHFISTSFDKIFVFFGLSQILAVLFSSTNKVQALTSLPWGLASILACIGLYFLLANSLTKKRDVDTLASVLGMGILIASFTAIIFWFEPFKNIQLPSAFDFLKNMRFSPVGNVVDTLILTGLLGLTSLVKVVQAVAGGRKPGVLSIAAMLVGLVACMLVGYRALVPPTGQQGIQLPPLETSWIAAIDSMKSTRTAIVGVGIDNYEAAFTAAKPRSYNTTDLWQINFNLASSMVLHIWTESGLFGLLMYLLLWIYIIREVQGLFAEKDVDAKTYAAWAAYLGLVTFALPASFITLFLTIVLCAILALKNNHYDEKEVSVDLSRMPLLYTGIALALFAIVASVGYLGSRAYTAEMYFKQSLDGVRNNNGQQVYNNLVKAIQINPFVERYHIQLSQVNLLLANNIAKKQEKLTDQDRQDIARFIQIAINEAKIPVQLNPNKVGYWNNLAVIYRNIINVAQGSEAWTVAAYRRAILQDPNNPLLRLNLGGVHYSLKDYEEAEKLFEVSTALKPDWANAFYNLAWAQFQNKKFDRAIASMQSVLKTLDKNSADYKKATENLEAFKEAAANTKKATATDSVAIRQGQDIALPEQPKPQLSPAVELPQGSGPESQIQVAPTGAQVSPTAAQQQ